MQLWDCSPGDGAGCWNIEVLAVQILLLLNLWMCPWARNLTHTAYASRCVVIGGALSCRFAATLPPEGSSLLTTTNVSREPRKNNDINLLYLWAERFFWRKWVSVATALQLSFSWRIGHILWKKNVWNIGGIWGRVMIIYTDYLNCWVNNMLSKTTWVTLRPVLQIVQLTEGPLKFCLIQPC